MSSLNLYKWHSKYLKRTFIISLLMSVLKSWNGYQPITHHYVNGEVDLESINNFWSSRLRLLAKSKRKLHLQMLQNVLLWFSPSICKPWCLYLTQNCNGIFLAKISTHALRCYVRILTHICLWSAKTQDGYAEALSLFTVCSNYTDRVKSWTQFY